MFGTKAIAVWVAIAAIVGTGSLAIATGLEQPVDIQHVSDAKIHLQDVDGKINTNVPVAASRAFSPLPIQFKQDAENVLASSTPDVIGSTIVTKQKVVINFVQAVSKDAQISIPLNNLSEDKQIFLIKAAAPPQVILDVQTTGSNVDTAGVIGNNEWLASIAGSATCGAVSGGTDCSFQLEVSTTDPGMYPIALELLRVG